MATMKSHAIIIQQEPIITAIWNPKISSLLAICCEGGRFYIWQDHRHGKHRSSVTAINVPAGEPMQTKPNHILCVALKSIISIRHYPNPFFLQINSRYLHLDGVPMENP
jgi:hypothetical protein